MSYITFDYKCPCGNVDTRMVKRADMDDQHCNAKPDIPSVCNQPMIRLPAGTRTTFRFADRKLKL